METGKLKENRGPQAHADFLNSDFWRRTLADASSAAFYM